MTKATLPKKCTHTFRERAATAAASQESLGYMIILFLIMTFIFLP